MMATGEIDLLSVSRGLIIAPAGCGKTQLIAEALSRHVDPKPILVLTHTNAGVVALRGRLDKASIPHTAYRLSTIDGWAIKLVSTFPVRSQIDPEALKLSTPRLHYPAIREAAGRLLKAGHIDDCLSATYSRLIVDEYQDCSTRQHTIISQAAQVLPTCVLGDPVQAIFGFSPNDPLVKCEEDGTTALFFPVVARLDRPWRWINVNCERLGVWLLEVRQDLIAGKSIDLRTAPGEVKWIELDGTTQDHGRLASAARWTGKGTNDGVLVIGDSRNAASRHQMASIVQGAIVIEPVDLGHMVEFLRTFRLDAGNALDRILSFAEEVMTGVGRPELIRRTSALTGGTARKQASDTEHAALSFQRLRTAQAAADCLSALSNGADVRVFRPTVLRSCTRALLLSAGNGTLGLHDAAIRVREQNRLFGRPLPKRAIGSTLLLKGLEAEAVVVLNADDLDARNLYVAMTRGSKSVTICSKSAVLQPAW
jgi:DNA helicase-2/ATP-dependent DNA helicase PcrA